MLPYSQEVFFSFLSLYNSALWPLLIVGMGLWGMGLVWFYRPVSCGRRLLAALLAFGWLWTGGYFLMTRFAALNFMAPLYGAFFVGQAGLMAWYGVRHGKLKLSLRAGGPGMIGRMICLYALIGYPLIDRLWSEDWTALRLAGFAPGPTVMLTLGVLALAGRSAPLILLFIPLLWCGVATYTAWALPLPVDYVLPVAGLITLAVRLYDRPRPYCSTSEREAPE
ncbi:DUF6064 family protein [Luteithermobacter gelatinilyticus]|uniref:DUF6064 family protein n=1 Tax=Luteithermobacter gelatinilyticus TaxID=2582913 RepID=UPI001FE7B8D2|nr:DUF6064 family protein [Luteithermobacter gelatinilyticus]|tara:strand:+ start:2629 stop:3297 length:669 start_codon:yes stop_codon:yes gene_type:complete